MVEQTNKPIEVFRAGAVSASIWTNVQEKDGKKFDVQSVTFQRGYTKDDGKTWENTTSMRTADLPKLALVTRKAYEYLQLDKKE